MSEALTPSSGQIAPLPPRGRWIRAHVVLGALGGTAVWVNYFLPGWVINYFLPKEPGESLGFVFTIALLGAALPPAAYQAWTLRGVVRPWIWLGSILAAIAPVPALFLVWLDNSDQFLPEEWDGIGLYLLSAFLIGVLWVAPVHGLAVLHRLAFRRWWLRAGPAAGVVVVIVAFGAVAAYVIPLAWVLTIALASAVYAVLMYPLLAELTELAAGGANS